MNKVTVKPQVKRVIVRTPGPQGPPGEVTGVTVTSVAGRTGAVTLTKTDVGLANVDNTSDASKPVSAAQGIADTAARDAAIAHAIQRANHTGTQPLSSLSQSGATTNQVVQWNGAAWVPATASGAGVDFRSWYTPGTYSWTNPSPSVRKLGRCRLIGGTGGGGSGRKGALGTTRCGGGGSAAACVYEFWFWTDQFPATVTAVVGAGGAGGAAVSANDTNGNAGAAGGDTTFYAAGFPLGFFAKAGGPGQGGTNSSGTGGTTTGSGVVLMGVVATNAAGGAASGTGGNGGNGVSSNLFTPTGGGSGGGITSANVSGTGGGGGTFGNATIGTGVSTEGGGSAAAGANGATPAPRGPMGQGGGGGGGGTVGNGGNGANGTLGAGAGGGGAATNGVGNSGAGGTGADGLAEITVFL